MAIPRNLTTKTQQAIEDTHSLANKNNHPELSSLHLLSALLNQDELALQIIEGKIKEGQKVKVALKQDRIIFT